MTPIFIVVKTNGEIWFSCDAPSATKVGGTIFKINAHGKTQKIATANGTTSVTASSVSGVNSDIN